LHSTEQRERLDEAAMKCRHSLAELTRRGRRLDTADVFLEIQAKTLGFKL
jgi:hypothetical protein